MILRYVTCSHHLNHRFWSGGFLLNGSTEPSIYKLSSRAPRFIFYPIRGYLPVWLQTVSVYPANSIRRASSRILIAAFRSRSIWFPHAQMYTLSESFSSFFTLPHLQHFLLDGKKRSTRTNLYKKIGIQLDTYFSERETGLEPAASTLARSRSTNWATRAFLIVLCSCWTQDIIYRIIPFLSTLFPRKIKVRNYMLFSENSHILIILQKAITYQILYGAFRLNQRLHFYWN